MRLYAITDRRLYSGGESARQAALLRQAERWVRAGVDFIQLREKDLDVADLEVLAGRLVEVVRRAAEERPARPRLLVNGAGCVKIAQQVGVDGVHLTGAEAFASGPRHLVEELKLLRESWSGEEPILSVACHTVGEVEAAAQAGASLVLFAPVFEKRLLGSTLPGAGLAMLGDACKVAAPIPVFALGGVDAGNARQCVEAGAAGIAGIRLFAGEDWVGI